MISEGPWFFDKNLVLLNEVNGLSQVHQIAFTHASFWVRLHDLSITAKNEYMGNLIRSHIGRVEEVDIEKDEMAWGEFMSIRVSMDITKPLLRGKKINIGGKKC